MLGEFSLEVSFLMGFSNLLIGPTLSILFLACWLVKAPSQLGCSKPAPLPTFFSDPVILILGDSLQLIHTFQNA